MLLKKPFVFTALVLLQLFSFTFATVSVKVYSRDEALTEINLSKPRIYIQNTGTEPISNISYNYYFKVENNEVPVADDYWTQYDDIHLFSDGDSLYHVKYIVSCTLQPGQIIPENSGNVTGIHYNSWGVWDKANDYSNNQSETFLENQNIVVYSNGTKIYGNLPDSTSGDSEPPSALEINSFALYATDSAKVKDSTIFSGGGAIGSNVNVDVGNSSVVNGNVISANTISLKSGSTVNGDIYVKGLVNIYSNVTVNGMFHENARVATLTIPIRTFTPGTADQTVASNNTVTLQPGCFRNVSVDSSGTLILLPGIYTFNHLLLHADAKVQLNVPSNQIVYLNIDKELEFQDRSEIKFQSHSYAPALQIYTNDTSVIRIGNGTKFNGILNAPHGTLTICSGAQCDGAIYAKKISVENGVSFSSSDIDPEGDPDHDGVANLLEALTGTDPLDPNSFKMMLLPNPVAINNTTAAVIKYHAAHFYSEFPSSDSICLTLPAGTLATEKRTVLMNVNNSAVNFNGGSIGGFSLPAGYSTISRFLSFEPDAFAAHKNMTITIPVSLDGYLESENYTVMYHSAGSTIWSIADVTIADLSDNTIGITATVQSPEALIIVSKKNAKITGYMDGGLVITGENAAVASIAFDLEIQDIPQSSTSAVSVDYYEMQNGTVSELKTVTVNFINMEDGNGGYKLVANTVNNPFTTANTITLSQIRITGAGVNYTCETSSTILQGQKLLLSAHCVPLYYNSSVSSVAWSYSNNFNLEAIDLNGEGRIRKVGHTFTCDYYVKDHLGSTREVINDEGEVTEATMYYPYGTMETLLKPPVNDNAREKFTGKELDVGETPASEVSFNIAINNFDAGMHYHGELYVNYTDLVYNRSFLKVYPLQYDTDADKFILNTADRFPDSMRVTNLRIATSGALSPINYERACDYTVITDSGLVIALDTSGSALINSSGVNYFTDSTYTPERVAGSNLYYFGARYYDAELGVWGSTDLAGQYGNTYSYCGGTPTIFRDNDGLIAVYVNGISGEDDKDFRKWIRKNYGNEYGGDEVDNQSAARWGQNYDPNVLKNMLKVGTIIGAMCEGYKVYSNTLVQAYYDLQPGDKLHVFGYSGGAASSGFASAMLNSRFGYGSVTDRVTYKGVDWLGFGTTFSGVSGTPTTHYYELGDPLSWVGSGMGELAIPAVAPFIDAVLPGISGIAAFMMMGDLSPNAVIADPASATDVMDPDKWFIGGDHSNTSDIKNGYTVWNYANDSWYKWAGIETAAIGSPAPTVLATYAALGTNKLISKATHWLTGLFH